MRKLFLIFALLLGVVSTYGQTGAEVINKYKSDKAVIYFNPDVNASKESLESAEGDIKTTTKGVLDKSFVDKFIANVKGVESLETIIVPASSIDLLKSIRADVSSLSGNGYNVIKDQKTANNTVGELSLAKLESTTITEVVMLAPVKDKNVYVLCDMKGHINVK